MTSSALSPGTEAWGYLMVGSAALVALLSMAGLLACGFGPNRFGQGSNGALLVASLASWALVGIVAAEMTATIPWGDSTPLGFDWGALLGLALSVLAAFGASVAWVFSTKAGAVILGDFFNFEYP